MPNRIEKINELLKEELAYLINRNIFLNDALITVTFVKCSPDLRYAKVGVSVLPDNCFGKALQKIQGESMSFNSILKKKLKLKFIPRFNFVADDSEKFAAEIEEVISKINQSEED